MLYLQQLLDLANSAKLDDNEIEERKLIDIESFRIIIKTSTEAEIHSEIEYENGILNNGNQITKTKQFPTFNFKDPNFYHLL